MTSGYNMQIRSNNRIHPRCHNKQDGVVEWHFCQVSIDNKGLGIVKEIVHRVIDNFHLVKLVDIDLEVELPGERLKIVNNDAGN